MVINIVFHSEIKDFATSAPFLPRSHEIQFRIKEIKFSYPKVGPHVRTACKKIVIASFQNVGCFSKL